MHALLTGPLCVETLTLPIANLPQRLSGLRVVQLSDFHWDGVRLSEELLNQAIAATNRAKPHLIALTGDFVTTSPEPIYSLASRLRALESSVGVFAVLGNHDTRPSRRSTIIRALTEAGIQVLWNQVAYPFGADFAVVGLADLWTQEFDPAPLFRSLPPQVPRLVLAHNPDCAEVLQQWRVDLQLSGHTHGGQIHLPGLGAPHALYLALRDCIPAELRSWLPYMRRDSDRIVRHWEWVQGLHQVGTNQLYVNRGLGTYYPGRLFCPPEVTVFTLVLA